MLRKFVDLVTRFIEFVKRASSVNSQHHLLGVAAAGGWVSEATNIYFNVFLGIPFTNRAQRFEPDPLTVWQMHGLIRPQLQTLGSDTVTINLRQRLPLEPSRILNRYHLRCRCAIEHDIQPVFITQALRRLVLIGRERDFADSRSSLHLVEPRLG